MSRLPPTRTLLHALCAAALAGACAADPEGTNPDREPRESGGAPGAGRAGSAGGTSGGRAGSGGGSTAGVAGAAQGGSGGANAGGSAGMPAAGAGTAGGGGGSQSGSGSGTTGAGGAGTAGGSGSGAGGAGGSQQTAGSTGAGAGGQGAGGASGGAAGTGGSPSGGSAGAGGAGPGDDWYPCDADASEYDAVVTNTGGTWEARRGSNSVYSGSDMRAAVQAGLDSLSANRTTKESVLVRGSGTISANSRISLPSYTVLNVCGTIDVTGSGSGDQAPLYARGRTDIDVPHVTITGAPLYAMFFRDVENLHLGQVELRVSGGLGIRIDNHGRSDRSDKVQNIRIDSVYAEGTGSHGVETYGVDQLTIGTVVARSTGECGVLLNDTTNAEIGLVDAEDAGTGTGYAAFRMANRNGRIGNAYPDNIHVGRVIARGGGRGIFCVSESGGAVIDHVEIEDAGGNSILLENCYNVKIAAVSGTVTRGGDIRIAARSEFANSSDITIQNLTVTDSALLESPCADNSVFSNNTLIRSSSNVCP